LIPVAALLHIRHTCSSGGFTVDRNAITTAVFFSWLIYSTSSKIIRLCMRPTPVSVLISHGAPPCLKKRTNTNGKNTARRHTQTKFNWSMEKLFWFDFFTNSDTTSARSATKGRWEQLLLLEVGVGRYRKQLSRFWFGKTWYVKQKIYT
jgi:hypothetical protein